MTPAVCRSFQPTLFVEEEVHRLGSLWSFLGLAAGVQPVQQLEDDVGLFCEETRAQWMSFRLSALQASNRG